MHLNSNEELDYNENEYPIKIKPLSGSCHKWNLIYKKVLLRKVIGILVRDPEEKMWKEKNWGCLFQIRDKSKMKGKKKKTQSSHLTTMFIYIFIFWKEKSYSLCLVKSNWAKSFSIPLRGSGD